MTEELVQSPAGPGHEGAPRLLGRDGTAFRNRPGIRPATASDGHVHRYLGVQQEIEAWEVWPEAIKGIQS